MDLGKLSRDPNPEVRWRVARHRGTPIGLLFNLQDDVDEKVSNEALRFLGIRAKATIDPEELDKLSNSRSWSVLSSVASNVNTEGRTLERIFKSSIVSDDILIDIAKNRNTPLSVLLELIHHEIGAVSRVAKKCLNERDVLNELLDE